jgi:hypothetical protein
VVAHGNAENMMYKFILTFLLCIFLNSVLNQQMQKWSTVYYITLVTMPVRVLMLLRHPQRVRVQYIPG